MKRLLSVLSILLLSVGVAFGSGAPENSGTTLKIFWWGSQKRDDVTQQVLQLYTKTHPHVTFQPTFQGYDGYFQKLSVLAAANQLPDIFQFYVGGGGTGPFIRKGLLEPLGPFVKSGTIDTRAISRSTLSTGEIGGKLYGIPLSINAKAMIVDPKAYQKAGLSVPANGYADWQAMAADLVALKRVTGHYGADDPFFNVDFMLTYFCRQKGQTIFKPGAGIGFDQNVYAAYMTLEKRWVQEDLVPPPDVSLVSSSVEQTQFVKGGAAAAVGYTNQLGAFEKASGKTLALIPLPGPNQKQAMDVRPGMHFSISARSANKNAAASFVGWFVNDVKANTILNADRGMPVSTVVLKALEETFSPTQKKEAQYLAKVSANSSPMDAPAPPGNSAIENLITNLDQKVLYNNISIADAYAQLKSQAASITASAAK